ncbi:MAG: DUF4065 domain-containing protein [Verrucomicrobia bacterium]|jgi:uncharacterized phage-associated protein|nr:DUF4065 domain-containing protein [Verrucomicrobiota bacterium]
MTYSAEAVANRFLELADSADHSLSNLKLQKLVYISQGLALGMTGSSLIHNHVHAWQYGPVFPKLYKKLRRYGSGKVCEKIESDDVVQPGTEADQIIKIVWEVYGDRSGSFLSTLTHEEDSPWSSAIEKEGVNAIIPLSDIESHYSELVRKAQQEYEEEAVPAASI